MSTPRQVARAFSLAESLSEEMIERGWTTEDVVRHMQTGRDPAIDLLCLDLLMCVQDDDLLIDSRTFDGLTRAFGFDPYFCRNMDAAWRRAPKEVREPFDPPEQIFGPISRRALMRNRGIGSNRRKK